MVDALGDTLPSGPFPRRIVSLSPNLTEILFAVGVDSSRIVGVTRFCDFPEAARRLPRVGGIVDPSLEELLARRPDLVLAVRGNPVEVLHRIRELGMPVFAFEDRTGLEGVERVVSDLISLVGPDDRERADEVTERFARTLESYRAWSAAIEADHRPAVYYADSEFPSWTAGPGSHVDDLIALAGGRNVVHGPSGWPQFSTEELLRLQPQVLLLAQPAGTSREELRTRLAAIPGWSALEAFRHDRICWIDSATMLRPGPRLLDALARVAECLHPAMARPTP
jgi:iron complex transport system substrate-binding protein